MGTSIMTYFKHGGDLGDTVLFLPTLKHHNAGLILHHYHRCRDPYTALHADVILPLVQAQPYCPEARYWLPSDADNPDIQDGNSWRNSYNGYSQLCYAQTLCYGVTLEELQQPWITVQPKPIAPVVINRSTRYNGHLDYHLAQHHESVFIGHRYEHDYFCERYYPIPYCPTVNLLEVAEIIAGSKVFIGNQSCCYAISEGLKHPTVQEVCPHCQTCLWERNNMAYSTHHTSEEIRNWIDKCVND
jgi:hypothetical protein